MVWYLVIIAAGFTQMDNGVIDRVFKPIGDPYADRAQCYQALEQQGPQLRGSTLACMPLLKGAAPNLWKSDRGV
jgi:hypothetical protein